MTLRNINKKGSVIEYKIFNTHFKGLSNASVHSTSFRFLAARQAESLWSIVIKSEEIRKKWYIKSGKPFSLIYQTGKLGQHTFLQISGRYLTKYGPSEVLNCCNQAAPRPPSPCLVEKYVSRSSVQKKSWLGRRAPCHAQAPVYQACPALRCPLHSGNFKIPSTISWLCYKWVTFICMYNFYWYHLQ